MEINKYTDIIGVVVREDIPEGRMVLLGPQSSSYDFGSRSDLPGVLLPRTDAEAQKAKYVVTWPVNNASAEGAIKMFKPMPSFDWALRAGGWDQAANVPFSATVYLTWPGNQEGVTIPSGYLALAFDKGVFTVPSGAYVFSTSIRNPGAALEVLNKADDSPNQGKLAYASAGTIAVVERYNDTTGALTFRTL